MYNLIVSPQVGDTGNGELTLERSRFLEYTSELISNQPKSFSVDAIESLKSWPCILMQEGRGAEQAFLVRLTSVQVTGKELSLTFQQMAAPFSNESLSHVRTALDIEQFEFHRNHWAVKDRDLGLVSLNGGTNFSAILSEMHPKPLPAPSRSQLISAKGMIAEWGHTKIDELVIEAGVAGLEAGRDLGGRRDRANAILKFALENPSAITAENRLFSAFLAERVMEAGHSSLDSAVHLVEETEQSQATPQTARTPNRVFIVHGQNNAARDEVSALLSQIGLQGIVLHEQPNMGRHLLTKFIDEAELVAFAIVVMTDDDVGSLRGRQLAPRARQNVILELGYFLARLGQRRICALISPGLETPSDFDGIVYIKMDATRTWQTELIRELRAAEMPIKNAPA